MPAAARPNKTPSASLACSTDAVFSAFYRKIASFVAFLGAKLRIYCHKVGHHVNVKGVPILAFEFRFHKLKTLAEQKA